jgi:hypothetical protein
MADLSRAFFAYLLCQGIVAALILLYVAGFGE